MPLAGSNIFHVRLANGQFQWTNKAADFSINDRRQYAQAFQSRISLLEFTLEEARAADALFRALEMTGKYLSASVIESTRVTDGNYNASLTEMIQSRAFALIR
jgi:hypothetical protein